MADLRSVAERKNPLGALEAFERAFGSNPDGARLIVKLHHDDSDSETMKTIHAMVDKNPSIILKRGWWDRPYLNALINNCDSFVSLHRAEGFGLPPAEAMYMGKPVIATGWSGNMEFMSPENSFPVNYSLTQLSHDIYPFKKGTVWAEPDLDHAADLMRLVANDEAIREKIGKAASESIRRHFSPQRIGKLMRDRLQSIAQSAGSDQELADQASNQSVLRRLR